MFNQYLELSRWFFGEQEECAQGCSKSISLYMSCLQSGVFFILAFIKPKASVRNRSVCFSVPAKAAKDSMPS